MNIRRMNRKQIALAGVMVFALSFGAVAAMAQPGGGGRGNQPNRGKSGMHMGRGGNFAGLDIDREALFAEALGISVEELETAQTQVRDAMIQEAVDQELITQEQADQIANRDFFGGRGGQGRGFALRGLGEQVLDVDREQLLADALGVTVDDLTAAQETARDAAVQEALDAGVITQEQLDQRTIFGGIGRGIGSRILGVDVDPVEITAQALGITAEELQASIDANESITDVLNELGLTAEEVREAMDTAMADLVQQAVEDGQITQAQADLLLEGGKLGFGNRGGKGFGFRGGLRGGPDTNDQAPDADSATAPAQTADL